MKKYMFVLALVCGSSLTTNHLMGAKQVDHGPKFLEGIQEAIDKAASHRQSDPYIQNSRTLVINEVSLTALRQAVIDIQLKLNITDSAKSPERLEHYKNMLNMATQDLAHASPKRTSRRRRRQRA